MANTDCAYEYTVKRGDSYYLISVRLGVPLRDLLAANPTIQPARLMVGDVLCIPVTGDVNTPAQCPDDVSGPTGEGPGPVELPTPEVDSGTGQTSPDENTDSDRLCPPANRVTIQEGQSLSDLQLQYDLSRHTFEVSNTNTDLENLRPGDTLCVPSANVPCEIPQTITLAAGESLASVAAKYNLPLATLLRVNPCLAPADFTQGAIVRLPQ